MRGQLANVWPWTRRPGRNGRGRSGLRAQLSRRSEQVGGSTQGRGAAAILVSEGLQVEQLLGASPAGQGNILILPLDLARQSVATRPTPASPLCPDRFAQGPQCR